MDPIILRIEPELDERAATSTMTRAQRVYEEGARDISKVMRQQLTQGTEAAGKGFDELETKARKAYLGMQDASEKVAAAERKHQAAVEKGAANAESLGRKVERARLAEIEAIEKATAAYKEYGQAADRAGHSAVGGLRGALAGVRSAGGEMASGFTEGFAGSAALARLGAAGGPIGIAIAGVAALGVTGGKVLADNIAAGMEQLRMRDLFQVRLGVDNRTMETIGTAAGTAYAKGFGGSVEENLKTVTAGIRSGLISPKSSDADLAKFTERMDTTSRITGQDPTEIAAKSRNVVRNGLAADYKEVLDLLNSAAGKQLDISGDLLDTLEEYSTAWHGVGLSAQDAVGLMKQMSDAGIRNTDVASDSLKELSINVADGSKLTKQAFTSMGFDAEDMNKRFAAGGATARDAFGAVLTALRDLQDPQDKENVGLALFKTKWEDAKTAIKNADLKTAASDMGNVAGATDDATPKINEQADSWGNLGRAIDNAENSFQRWLANTGPGNWVMHTLPDALSRIFEPEPPSYVPPPPSSPAQQSQDLASLMGDAPVQGPGLSNNVGVGPRPTPPAPGDIPGMLGTFLTPNPNLPVPPPGVQHGPQSHMPTATDDAAGSKSLPPAPVRPLMYTSTAGLPSGIANAQQSLDERKHDVAEKQARLDQLEQGHLGTEEDRLKAKNDLIKAQQDQFKAEQALTDARINATKQANKQMAGLSSDLDQLGASLDKDFGISKGLGGIVENLVKAVGNALAAPFLQALGFVAKANPNEGSGLVGVLAANGMFGPQYTPGAIAASQAQSGTPMLPGATTAALGGNANAAIALAQSANGGQYGWGASDLANKLADCSGAVSDLVEVMQNGSANAGRLFNTEDFPAYAASHGWQRGMMAGALNVGVSHGGPGGGHMAATLPNGVNFESGGSHGGIAYGGPAAGASDKQFTEQWYLPTTSTGAPAPTPTAGPLGPPAVSGPIPSTLAEFDRMYNPGGVPATGGAPLHPGIGPANALPGVSPLGPVSPAVGGGVPYPTTGGNSGNVLGGLPMDGLMAAAGAADLMMPGAGAAAKIGIQVANRTIGYMAQNAGILANGVGEFFSVGDNPKGSLGAGWLGKLAGGIAGAAPALPNLAGGKKPPGPMDQATGGQQQGGDTNVNNQINVQAREGASGQEHGEQVAAETSRMWAPAGRQ
jgi:phage-related minor tail protein